MSKVGCTIDYAATRRWLATRYVIGTVADDELPDVLRGDLDADDDVVADSGDEVGSRQDLEDASWDELFAEFERSQLREPAAPRPQPPQR